MGRVNTRVHHVGAGALARRIIICIRCAAGLRARQACKPPVRVLLRGLDGDYGILLDIVDLSASQRDMRTSGSKQAASLTLSLSLSTSNSPAVKAAANPENMPEL